MTPENLLTEWSRLLVESLADAGLKDVVSSPGSRSTPFVWAALECKRLRTRSVIDERSAAFFAVGHAKMTGTPVALLCTSGSATANYFPAIVEASIARVPLLVITADRPFELHDASAPQTIDQVKLYGDYVRRFVEVGMPDDAPLALSALRRRAAQSLFDTTWPVPGPVHLNVRARKPLEPASATSPAALDLAKRVDAIRSAPITRPAAPRLIAADDAIRAVADDCTRAARGLIVCGPLPIGSDSAGVAVVDLARALNFPVYAEATSQLRFGGTLDLPPTLTADGLDLVLRSHAFCEAFAPDVVVQIGAPPTSSAWERFCAARPGMVRHVIPAGAWPDPASSARSIVIGDVGETIARVAEAVAGPERSSTWSDGIARASDTAWNAVDRALEAEAGISEGHAVRAVVEALPKGALLAVGNSLPVRHLDAFCRARPSAKNAVWSQRGASGIDGLVSGAAGAADAAAAPTLLLLGDVSAVHDLGGFAVAAETKVPFVIVILDNGGGRIFEQLPLLTTGLDEDRERYWTTPHGVRFEALSRLFELDHAAPKSVPEIVGAVRHGLSRPGCTVVEINVPPHGARDQYRGVASAVDAALEPLLGSLGR